MSEPVVVTDEGAVRIIRLNRPEKKNALTQPMYAAMTTALREAGASAATRCVMFAGGPGAFCAGADIGEFLEAAQSGGLRPRTLEFLNALVRNDKPLVAAVGGLAVGIGTTMLLHCDHVVAAAGAVFSTPFAKLGLIPEAASSLLAPMRMGYARAFALLVMGRPLSAAEAKDAGIVNTVVDAAAVDATALQAAQRDCGASRRRRRRRAGADARSSRRGRRANRNRSHAFQGTPAIRGSARRVRGVSRAQEVRSAMSLAGKTLFITGASRGIGLAIALRAARDGANVAIAAKTAAAASKTRRHDLHRRRTKSSAPAARRCRSSSTCATKPWCATRWKRPRRASAASISSSTMPARSSSPTAADTDMKRFDLMHQINARGTFMVSKWAIALLAKAANPHILMISPPLDMKEKWFAPHTAYSMAKFGMSLVVLGLAGELRGRGIAVNALWPRTVIATAAVQNLLGGDAVMGRARKPEIMADAAYAVFAKPAREFTGRFLIDDNFLAANGVTDFEYYRVDPTQQLVQDFFVPDDIAPPPQVRTIVHFGGRP